MITNSITGVISEMSDETFVTTKTGAKFPKRDIVVREFGERENTELPVTFTGNRAGLPEGFAVGDTVTVNFDIRTRKWIDGNAKHRIAIRAEGWRIEPAD